ncbi:CHAT domain-containing tetratricopeptide repeat protein [uncultured Aquimarina sp.]|uniref:CHAT domain-containing protein n=1 Tax=uncultured Aquimarina sp. TaxID=575652 RepID=UPI00260914C2|nr:CHAT domain-containing tetratricopeptide repeat protein [uncultured Aquimarina sp.]
MNPLKTIVLLLFFTSLSFSQSKTVNDTILASQYFKKADSLLADRKLDSAIVYFKNASPIYEKAQAWGRVAGCYNGIAKGYNYNFETEKAFSSVKKAQEINKIHIKELNKEEATSYVLIGDYFSKKRNSSKAIENYQKGLEIRLELYSENDYSVALCNYKIGVVQAKKAEFNQAMIYFEKALTITNNVYGKNHKKAAIFYNALAIVYGNLEDYDKAIEYYKKSINLKVIEFGDKHPTIANYYYNIGTVYLDKDREEEGLSYLKKALAIYTNNKNKIRVASVYNAIGFINMKKGLYNTSMEYFKKSLELYRSKFGENHLSISESYANIGLVYKEKEMYDKALEYQRKSINIEKNLLGEEHNSLISNYHNLGIVYHKMKKYDLALENYNKGLSIIMDIYGDNHSVTAHSYNNLAKTYEELENYDTALEYYIKSQNIYRDSFGEKHTNVANAYNYTANVYIKTKDYKKALMYFEKALRSNTKLKISKIEGDTFKPDQFLDLSELLVSLEGKAKVFKYLYKKNNQIDNLKKSITVYKECILVINLSKEILKSKNDRLAFSKKNKNIFSNAIEAHILYIDQNQDSLEEIWYYLEKSKSNTLKDLLNISNAKTFSGLSIDIIDLEKDLRINKAFYQSKINKEVSNKQIDSVKLLNYENKLFDISRRQDSLTEALEKNYPKYHQLKYNNEVVSVVDVQEKIDDKTTLLEFFTADSITYAFTISKNKIAVKELSTAKLDEQIEQFRSSITKNYEAYKEISHQLYQTLVTPIKDQLIGNQLIIVPDGSLWHLNFDLLLTEEDPSNNPKTGPYFLKEYAISHANSATLLFSDQQEKVISKKQQECLAFSFSSGDTISTTRNVSLKTFRNSSMDLPGTREEIKAIANIVDGNYFYGSEATEENFKKHAGAYNILHLALHGDVDNERPENSKLYFTKSKDTIEDNYLYSHELFALDIPAELTVLSACNTGTGKIAKGEGIMSLGNAFQYAGTKSLLLTNWEVSDQTTPKIMEYFYTHLKEGKNKAEALQQAKLQFLATTNEETIHPYYWGGFYLLGDTAPIKFQDNSYVYWVIGFGVLAIISLSLFWYRKQHSK